MDFWSVLYTVVLYSTLTLVGLLVFYAINRVAQATWATHLYPIMQRVSAPLWVVTIALLALLAWRNAEPYYLLRAGGYTAVWLVYRYGVLPRATIAEKTYPHVLFLVVFFLTELPLSTDWLLSLTPHWHSSLYSWYVLSSLLLSAMALGTLFSRSEHYADMGKYVFAFSCFWAYLWYSQFMLIWYANIPEETAYYEVLKANGYTPLLILMMLFSFVLPFLLLLSAAAKRRRLVLFAAVTLVLIGQFLNFYLLIVPFANLRNC